MVCMILIPLWSPRQAEATRTIDVSFMDDLTKPPEWHGLNRPISRECTMHSQVHQSGSFGSWA